MCTRLHHCSNQAEQQTTVHYHCRLKNRKGQNIITATKKAAGSTSVGKVAAEIDDVNRINNNQPIICQEESNTAKKRRIPLENEDNREQKKKFIPKKIDLTGVRNQPPILRFGPPPSRFSSKKYQGVSFDEATKKWLSKIQIDGEAHHIGSYGNEKAAAIDYARAVFKYKCIAEVEVQRPPCEYCWNWWLHQQYVFRAGGYGWSNYPLDARLHRQYIGHVCPYSTPTSFNGAPTRVGNPNAISSNSRVFSYMGGIHNDEQKQQRGSITSINAGQEMPQLLKD